MFAICSTTPSALRHHIWCRRSQRDKPLDAFPEHVLGAQIKEIGAEASETTRTYPITLIMDQPEDVKLLPGMAGKASGRAELPEGAAVDSVEIPVSATFAPGALDQTYVWVVNDETMTVSQREITTGDLTDLGIKVIEGLDAGEWVVTAGVHYLQDGQKIRILEQ